MPSLHSTSPKQPRLVLDSIYAFPPNRETLGATAYFIVGNGVNILIDCPAWIEENRQFLQAQGGVKTLAITHRGAIAKVGEIQQMLGCQVVIQEQEAYLLPGVEVTAFTTEISLAPDYRMFWTCGHSPGSACVYTPSWGGILFSGRHLLPNSQGKPTPLRTSKTFHWWRQLQSVERLLEQFTPETLNYLCPGANTGFLRGKGLIEEAYSQLSLLNLGALRLVQPGI